MKLPIALFVKLILTENQLFRKIRILTQMNYEISRSWWIREERDERLTAQE